MKIRGLACGWLLFVTFLNSGLLAQVQKGTARQSTLALSDGWNLQSSGKVAETGDVISKPGYQPRDWYKVSVPTTVVAALVKEKVYPDPNFGMNLRQFPGVTYRIGANFSNISMEQDSPFAMAWWYRKAFALPAGDRGKTIWLDFNGINYRANVWVNGKKIADAKDVAGTFVTFEFNVSKYLEPGKGNAIALEIFAPLKNDLESAFLDASLHGRRGVASVTGFKPCR